MKNNTRFRNLYDVLTSIEKIGEITDLELEEEIFNHNPACYTSINLEAENIGFKFPDSNKKIINDISLKIKQGEKLLSMGKMDQESQHL